MTLEEIEKEIGFVHEGYCNLDRYSLLKLFKVAASAREYWRHSCGLKAWLGKCTVCNDFMSALEDLEKG